MQQNIKQPSPEDAANLTQWLEVGTDIMAAYGVDPALSVYENMDLAYEGWADDDSSDKASDHAIVLGLAQSLEIAFAINTAFSGRRSWISMGRIL